MISVQQIKDGFAIRKAQVVTKLGEQTRGFWVALVLVTAAGLGVGYKLHNLTEQVTVLQSQVRAIEAKLAKRAPVAPARKLPRTPAKVSPWGPYAPKT